jgi:formamidopyrimidine-DNA glycosylase
MNELPETNTLAKQAQESLVGKTISSVDAAASPHKFAWYHGDPADYPNRLMDNIVESAQPYGMMVEIGLSGSTLLFSDGVKLRLHPDTGPIPKKHQLLLGFDDGTALSASLAMYGGLFCWEQGDEFENMYYDVAREKPSPLTDAFDEAYFNELMSPEDVRKLSLKAALATEQRIPGLGNGCLQDILWHARLNPRQKLKALSASELDALFTSLKETLAEMTRLGGRSTEQDLFGTPGGYQVVMCAENKGKPCPRCGCEIIKESYMGGSVYTCPQCQPR